MTPQATFAVAAALLLGSAAVAHEAAPAPGAIEPDGTVVFRKHLKLSR